MAFLALEAAMGEMENKEQLCVVEVILCTPFFDIFYIFSNKQTQIFF
jgi:hypothetical protein